MKPIITLIFQNIINYAVPNFGLFVSDAEILVTHLCFFQCQATGINIFHYREKFCISNINFIVVTSCIYYLKLLNYIYLILK